MNYVLGVCDYYSCVSDECDNYSDQIKFLIFIEPKLCLFVY